MSESSNVRTGRKGASCLSAGSSAGEWHGAGAGVMTGQLAGYGCARVCWTGSWLHGVVCCVCGKDEECCLNELAVLPENR